MKIIPINKKLTKISAAVSSKVINFYNSPNDTLELCTKMYYGVAKFVHILLQKPSIKQFLKH